MGLAVDAMPSVSPALWLSSPSACAGFFACYVLGTMSTMGLLAAVVGESTLWLGAHVVSLPSRLAVFSAYSSLTVGLCWLLWLLLPEARIGREVIVVLLLISPCVLGTAVWALLRELGCFGEVSQDSLYLSVARVWPSLAYAWFRPVKKLKVGDTPLQSV